VDGLVGGEGLEVEGRSGRGDVPRCLGLLEGFTATISTHAPHEGRHVSPLSCAWVCRCVGGCLGSNCARD